MRIINVNKMEQGENATITFGFYNLDQIFDEADPRPLPEKEISEIAEDTLVGYMDEYPPRKPLDLVIELPQKDLTTGAEKLIPDAIHHHFSRRLPVVEHDMRLFMRDGMFSGIITVINLIAAAIFIYLYTAEIITPTAPVVILGFILMISNWATFWHTIEMFLYDYRDLKRKIKIYRKISTIPILIRAGTREPG